MFSRVAVLLGLMGCCAGAANDGIPTVAVPDRLINVWPKKWESDFQRRAKEVIAAQVRDTKPKVNTYFENEKRSYGFLMAHVMGGDRELALKSLQSQDHQHEVWHRETAGIDYYACFTLKHQMRKYFYFGDRLDPDYRKRMFRGLPLAIVGMSRTGLTDVTMTTTRIVLEIEIIFPEGIFGLAMVFLKGFFVNIDLVDLS